MDTVTDKAKMEKEKEKRLQQARIVKALAERIFMDQLERLSLAVVASSEKEIAEVQNDLRMKLESLAAGSVSAAIRFQQVAGKLISTHFNQQ